MKLSTKKPLYLAALLAMNVAAVPVRAQTEPSQAPQTGCRSPFARYDVAVPGRPADAVATADGQMLFVSLVTGENEDTGSIAVLTCSAGQYEFTHQLSLPDAPFGLALSHDGKVLLVADDRQVVFIDAAALRTGRDVVLGKISDVTDLRSPQSIWVNFSPDDRFVFVSDEHHDTITVIDRHAAETSGYSRTAIVGAIPVGLAPIALTFSHDGNYLFTTSEIAPLSGSWPSECLQEGVPQPQARPLPAGEIITIDVAKAERAPASSVVGVTRAQCSPVRLDLSPDGATAWVPNRASNTLIGYSTSALVHGNAGPQAVIPVGAGPVPVLALPDGRYVLVGEANRFASSGTPQGFLDVVDVTSKSVMGRIAVGSFPRNLTLTNFGSVILTNYGTQTVSIFDVEKITGLAVPLSVHQ